MKGAYDMKKYLSIIIAILLVLSLTACRKMPDSNSSAELSVIKDFVYITEETQSDNPETDNTQSEEVVLDQSQKSWQSTIIAPTTVTFYKDGMQSVSTDKEFNHKIAKHIEEWYKKEWYKDIKYGVSCNCLSKESDVTELKHNEMAIQLEFDDDINMYGGFISSSYRRIFIPLTGEKWEYVIFATGIGPSFWSHYYVDGSGLEKYFEGRQFEPIPEWQSTIIVPKKIQLYQNGVLLSEYTDVNFTYKVAQHIESWHIYKDSIEQTDVGITADTIQNIRDNETYIEIFFSAEITFYGKNMILPETKNLLIPLSGNYAYCIFEAGKDFNYNSFTVPEKATGLEQFFEIIYDETNNS